VSRSRSLAAAVLSVVAVAASSGCSHDATAGSQRTVTVLAAASLSDAFTAMADAYEQRTPGTHVRLSFAGSQQLVAQVTEGSPGDVLATADTSSMARARRLADGTPATFARNSLEIAVAPGNPKHVRSLADLGRRDLVVVLAAEQVPAGRYAAAALRAAGVRVHPASLEENVRGVLTKVELGEADAGVVYTTDVRSAGGKVASVPVSGGPTATYPIVSLTAAGQGFVRFVLSTQGRRILASFGFLPP
jgi:molybdate transport system substrate-binding protein